MAPRGRKKLIKSSTTTSTSATQRAPSRAHEQEPRLPSEVLEEIFNRLSLKDNIRASVVCKSWQSPAISVRKANTPPWLMSYLKSGDLFEFGEKDTPLLFLTLTHTNTQIHTLTHCNKHVFFRL
ncbi:hypothetical protein ABFX02_12G154000 [Erythranthe guttata]